MASNELDIADDIEASDYFNLAVLNNGVTLKVSEPLEPAEPPPRRNLFALSNLFGLAVAATNNGFAVFALSALRQAYTTAKQRTQAVTEPLRTVVIGDGGLTFLKIGLADKVVIASGPALQGGVGVWRLKSLVDGTSTTPLHVFPPATNAALVDVLPNPSDRPELLALLYQDGQIVMINMDSKATIGTFGQGITAACWSVKGKQIVCGDQNGNLTQYTPEGEPKTVTEAPTSLRGRGIKVLDIRWVENAVFFVTYCDAENPMDTSIFVSTRAKDGSVTYSGILDPLMVETMDRPEARFNAWLKNWTPFKHLLLVCNATSNTIGHVGLGPVGEGGDNIAWSAIKNDLYTTLPLDTYPLGLEVDLTDINPPSADDNAGTNALPTLWSYASDGTLSAWRIVNLKGEPYPSIASPKDIVTEEDAGQQATAAATATPAVSAQASAAAGSPFGTSASPTAFGSTTFGTGTFSSPPSFGRPPSFGAPPSFAPAFGQPGLGTAAAFGKPAFGQPALAPAVAPAKGGFSGFSTQASGFASPSSTIATSPFASASASPSPTPAFVSSQPAAFGTSTFGQPSTPSGSASMATSPAPAAFGQSSPFGMSTSTTSPFSSTKPTSGGFGAFAPSSDAKTTPSGFGAFSSTTSGSTSGFGFGTPSTSTEATKNAFGTSQPSAFTGLREESAVASTPAVKPPGLDENDAEDMEPKDTTPQTGGALDFGDEIASDDEKQDTPLSFGGLGFGGSKPAATPGAAPAAFGGFGKAPSPNPVGSTSTVAASPFAAKQEAPAASKPTFSFGGFGQGPSDKPTEESKKPEGNQKSAAFKPAFSFAKPASAAEAKSTAPAQSSSPFGGFGKPSASTDDKKSTEGGAASSPFGSFGKPASASQTSAFGQPATFGKPAAFGQPPAFGQASAFGSKSTFRASQEKPSFSFGTPASESKSTGGFSSFASSSGSPSTSPFASPAAKTAPPVTPAFGQPGLFKGFGQAATPSDQSASKEGAVKDAPVPPSEAPSREEGAPAASSDVDTVKKAASDDTQEEREALQTNEESELASETIPPIKQEALSDSAVEDEHEEQEVAVEEEDQEDREEEPYDEEEDYDEEEEEAYDEGEEYGNEEEEEEDESVAQEPSEQFDEKTGTGDEAEDEIVVPSASPSPARSDESGSPPGSPSPAPTISKLSEISSDSAPRTTFAPAKSAFSFAPAASKDSAETSKPAATPLWSFGAQQASKETPDAASSSFSGFGQASSAKPDENAGKQTPKPAEGSKPTFEGFGQPTAPAFSLPTTKAADSPKPFGLGNLQKATPRTSSPLASMPSFAPPASPSQTQSTFDLSNLSSTTSSPNASPTKPPQNLPVSTTPQAKPPAQTFFSQANKESGTSPNDQKTQALPAATPKATPTPNVAAEAVLSTVPPKLTSALPKDRQTPHVSQDTLNVFITMQEHLDALKESAAACMAFFHSVQPARLPKEKLAHPVDILDYDVQWSMGDLPRLREATRSLSKTLAEVSQQAKDEEKAARSLEGSLLKTKAKSEEINRYLKAREDPQVAKMVRVRQLGPEQLENQNRIRRQTQNVNEALDELERTILGLKEKVLEEKLGRSPMQAPSLDSIYRAIRNLTAGLQSKIIELDDIGLRLDMAALTTDSPKKQADTTPKAQRLLKGASPAASENGSAARSAAERSFSHAPKRHVLHTTSRIERSVRRTLAAEEFGQKLKDAWLAHRKEPLLNTSANSVSH